MNKQWAVSNSGLETIKPAVRYEIKASRLTETTERADETFYAWPLRMAEKQWINMDAFAEAFSQALELHKGRYTPEYNRVMLRASLAEARFVRSQGY